MSLTGSGPDDPQRVGVPIADLLSGMYGAYGVLAALHERRPHRRRARSSAPRCSPRSSACTPSRAPGGPSPARSAARRATTTRRSRRTACSTAATARCRSRVGSEGLWRRFCEGFGLDPDDRRAGDQPRAGRPTGERVIEVVEEAFADWDAEPLLARLAEVGVPAGKVRTLDEVYAWDQTASQGLLVDVEHPTLGPRDAARPAAALLRRRRRRGHPPRPRGPARCSTSTRDAIRAWLGGARTRRDEPGAGRPQRAASTWSSTTGSFESWDQPIDIVGHSDAGLPAPSSRRPPSEGRHRRVGADRPRPGARPAGGRRGQRVRLPRRLDRARPPAQRIVAARTPGHRRGAARCWPPPPPAAPGCRRARPPSSRWSRSPGP